MSAGGGGVSSAIRKWVDRVSNPGSWFAFENDKELSGTPFLLEDPLGEAERRDQMARVEQQNEFLIFPNGDYFEGELLNSECHRVGVVKTVGGSGGGSIAGQWVDNLLEGMAEINYPEGLSHCTFRRGVLHGMTRKFGPAKGRSDNLRLIAFYDSGRVKGVAWKGLLGGAFLVGTVDNDEGGISGTECMYIYPDLHTVIFGEFRSDQLVSGWTGTIADIGFDNHILVPKVGRRFCGQEVTRDTASNRVMCNWPMQRDHWEEKRVEVRRSLIASDNAGEGLFAKINFLPGQVVALFNGLRIQSQRSGNSEEGSEYRIRFNSQIDLDVPEDMTGLDNYCATLGHKTNHSFRPNAKWTRLEHPRFGLICSITAVADIKAGEEILVNYGLGMSAAPLWYKDLWIRHCREDQGLTDQQIKDWCWRQYEMNGRFIELSLSSREKA